MGFVTKIWKDPVNIDSNNLNRIEQGIKNSHDTLEILEEEVSNLQTKQLDILEQLKTSTPNISSDTILEQLNSILGDTEILTALKNADNFLTKSAQELTKSELNQVYKNLDLDRMLKLTDIRVNDTSAVQGSIASITLPKVDKILNLNSNNAISNSAVVRAINKLIKDIENNTTFYLKDAIEDDEHMTVSRDEIVRWNSINVDSFLTEESDPTVPAWAKAPTKPIYTYNEIVGTPTIPTDNIELENGRGYITSSEASTIANNLLNTFQTNTINPLSSRVTNLEAMDITLTTAINNKADANHTHSNLASITWVTEEIEDKIAELVGSAPATLDTIQELAAALNNHDDIIDTINSTIANKTTVKFGNTIQTTVTFDSDPQTQLDGKANLTGENTFIGDQTIQGNISVTGQLTIPTGPLTVSNINILERLNTVYNNYVISVGGLKGAVPVKTLSSKNHLSWNSGTESNNILIAKSTLAFWNGAYGSNNASNLTYCAGGSIIHSGSAAQSKSGNMTFTGTVIVPDVTIS